MSGIQQRSELLGISGRGINLDYVYFIENVNKDKYHDNSLLFQYIYGRVPEENIYADSGNDKHEWSSLVKKVQSGDKIILRSLLDLADSRDELLGLLHSLHDDGILLYSVEEPALSGDDYVRSVYGS